MLSNRPYLQYLELSCSDLCLSPFAGNVNQAGPEWAAFNGTHIRPAEKNGVGWGWMGGKPFVAGLSQF